MPDNRQARTDDMPPNKGNKHKGLTNIILLVIILGVLGFIIFGR